MSDDLSAPLTGRKRRPGKGRAGRHWPLARIGAGVLVLLVAGIGAWVVLVDDPSGGRPSAEVSISAAPPSNPLAENLDRPAPPAAEPRAPASGPSFITLGDDIPTGLVARDEADSLAGLPALLEETRHGPIPRVSASGERPFSAYARPSLPLDSAGGRAMVAVVMTGLGLSDAVTAEAISSLPGAVTLAFAPYGGDLVRHAASARASGHEIMLEIPLEPFDYPQNDPGPHTLLVERPARENIDNLHWLLARFGGYTGLVSHMGARFTASAAEFSPVMEEVGLRGLSWLDDGSSNRSIAASLAGANGVPFARSDLELDANPSRAAILDALGRLERQAMEHGHAVGTVSALPVSIRTVSEWAANLDSNLVLLVPLSTLAGARAP